MNINEVLIALDNNDLEYLSTHKFNINYRVVEQGNDTIFLYALSVPQFSYIDHLLKLSPDIFAVNDENENIIHSAVFSGSLSRVEEIFNKIPDVKLMLNTRAKDGTTPLLQSIVCGHLDISSFLINMGADVNISDNEQISPLHSACYEGNLSLVKQLIENGAHVFAKTKKNNYPLALAVNEDRKEVVKYLVDKYY